MVKHLSQVSPLASCGPQGITEKSATEWLTACVESPCKPWSR